MAIHASLNIPAAAQGTTATPAEAERHAAVAELAARHGIDMTASPELLRWLVKADLPPGLDEPGFAALSALVRHIYTLATPGGGERGGG